MIQKYGTLIQEDLNVGVDRTWVSAPSGGELRVTQIGLHTLARGQQSYTAGWTPGTLVSGGYASSTVTVPDAVPGDLVMASYAGMLTSGLRLSAHVSAADTVTVILHNPTAVSVTPPTGDITALVFDAIASIPPPVAHFSWATFDEDNRFDYDASASTGTITDYAWDFGDGSGTSSLQADTYNYASWPLTPTVLLTVTGPGGVDSVSAEVTVGVAATGSV